MRLFRIALIVASVLAPTVARADDDRSCMDVTPSLLTSDLPLKHVADAVSGGKPLDILVIGSRSSTLPGPGGEATAYPVRLQDALRSSLPGVTVNVTSQVFSKKTAEDTAADLDKLIAERKPSLVVWQTGTIDALRSIDTDEFRAGLDTGIAAMQKADADVILMNLQYSPRMDSIIWATPYLDAMRVAAQEHGALLFDRFSIMREWHEAGTFDLFSASRGLEVARKVHDCLGRALAKLIISAAHLGAPETRIQR